MDRPPLPLRHDHDPGGAASLPWTRPAREQPTSTSATLPSCRVSSTRIRTSISYPTPLGKCPPSPDFTAWLRLVIDHRRRQTPQDVANAIDIGLAQCRKYGNDSGGRYFRRGRELGSANEGAAASENVLRGTWAKRSSRVQTAFAEATQWIDNHVNTWKPVKWGTQPPRTLQRSRFAFSEYPQIC